MRVILLRFADKISRFFTVNFLRIFIEYVDRFIFDTNSCNALVKLVISPKRLLTSLNLSIGQKLFKFWNEISENLKNCKTSPFLSSVKLSGVKFSINLDSKFS